MTQYSGIRSLNLLWYVGMAVFAITLVVTPIIMESCNGQQTEAEKQRIAQMDEQLHRAYNDDLLEFRDGSVAIVTNKNDFGLATRYSIGTSVRQSYESLARNVVAIYAKDHPDRCQAAEKFIASF